MLFKGGFPIHPVFKPAILLFDLRGYDHKENPLLIWKTGFGCCQTQSGLVVIFSGCIKHLIGLIGYLLRTVKISRYKIKLFPKVI